MWILYLSHWGNRGNDGSRNVAYNFAGDLAIGVLLGAITRNVTGLTALVASLASGVQRATVGSGAVPRDVAELAAGVAFHGLSLAIPGKVVRTTALVAGSRTGTASIAAPSAETTDKSTPAHRSTTTHGRTNRIGASTLRKIVRTHSLVISQRHSLEPTARWPGWPQL